MHLTRQTVVTAGIVAVSAFCIGWMTGQPPGPTSFNECARHVSNHGATEATLSAAYSVCVAQFGSAPQ